MELKEQLTADLKTAMKAGDKTKRNALRSLLAAVKQAEIDGQTTLDEAGVLAVVTKQAKMRSESISEFSKAGRDDLVGPEQAELTIYEAYLPELMGREEVTQIAQGVIDSLGVTDVKGMGQVMGKLMPQLKGKADGRIVNEVVRSLLQSE